MWESRIAPLSGLGFVVLLVAGSLVVNNFEFMPPQEDIAAFYGDNATRIMAGGYLGLLSSFFLLWFAGTLREALKRVESGSDRLSTLAFGGGVLAAAMVGLGYMATFYGAERASVQGSIDPGGAAVIFDLASGVMGTVAPFGFAALIGSYAVAHLRSRRGPAWLVWSSLVIAIGLVSPFNWIVIGLAVIWVAVVSIRLYRDELVPVGSSTNVAAGSTLVDG